MAFAIEEIMKIAIQIFVVVISIFALPLLTQGQEGSFPILDDNTLVTLDDYETVTVHFNNQSSNATGVEQATGRRNNLLLLFLQVVDLLRTESDDSTSETPDIDPDSDPDVIKIDLTDLEDLIEGLRW
jgi:hypothetical protein